MNRVFCGSIVLLSVVMLSVAVQTANAGLISDFFTWKYEMNIGPEGDNQNGVEGGDMDYYTKASGNWVGPTAFDGTVGGGTITMPDTFMQFYSDHFTATHVWSGIDYTTGYTMEIKMQSHQSSGSAVRDSLGLMGANTLDGVSGEGVVGNILVGDNGLWWGQYVDGKSESGIPPAALLSGVNNSDAMHTFRFVQLPGEDTFHVWRDNVLVGSFLSTTLPSNDANFMVLGNITGAADQGASAIDYLRITAGAYAPLGQELPVLRPGDANRDGFVDEADAAALAAHWLQQGDATWVMGDFNGDYNVDDVDATMLAVNWNPKPSSVPEPGSLLLLVGGLITLLAWRRLSR